MRQFQEEDGKQPREAQPIGKKRYFQEKQLIDFRIEFRTRFRYQNKILLYSGGSRILQAEKIH